MAAGSTREILSDSVAFTKCCIVNFSRHSGKALSDCIVFVAGHGKKKKKWQQEEPEESAGAVVPAGPKKVVPKPYMADAKFVTSEFQTTGMVSPLLSLYFS